MSSELSLSTLAAPLSPSTLHVLGPLSAWLQLRAGQDRAPLRLAGPGIFGQLEAVCSQPSYFESAVGVPKLVNLSNYRQFPLRDSADKGGNGSSPDPRTGDSRCPSILDVRIANIPPIPSQPPHRLRLARLFWHPASSFCGLP
jgi:hypothetical protein